MGYFIGCDVMRESRAGRIWCDCRGNQVAQSADEVMAPIASKFIVNHYRG